MCVTWKHAIKYYLFQDSPMSGESNDEASVEFSVHSVKSFPFAAGSSFSDMPLSEELGSESRVRITYL